MIYVIAEITYGVRDAHGVHVYGVSDAHGVRDAHGVHVYSVSDAHGVQHLGVQNPP